MAIALIQWLSRGMREGVYTGLIGFVPAGIILLFRFFEWPLQGTAMIALTVLLCAVAVAMMIETGPVSRLRKALNMSVLVLPALALAAFMFPAAESRDAGGSAYALGIESGRNLPRIERHVIEKSRYVKVFVCGYEGIALLDRLQSDIFVHSLDFNFYKARNDYRGHILYLLIHAPRERSAMDSIFRKYRGIFTFGGVGTLYDNDWGDWRLFEIVQAEDDR
jgi:hypothetical protein